ncbi:MAG: hypothetical protein PHG02_00285 [Oscillospiraceae bacterium]|nr:hypothetical protein [Oscillospiraceae bacterium]
MIKNGRVTGKKRVSRLKSAALCLAAAFFISGCSAVQKPLVSTVKRADVNISTLTYTAPSYAQPDELVARANTLMQNTDGMHLINRIKVYGLTLKLEPLLQEIATQNALLFITYLKDQTNADAQLACAEMDNRLQGYQVDLNAMYAYITGTPLTLQQQAAEDNRAQIQQLSDAEAQLQVAYNQLYYNLNSIPVNIDGTPMTYDEILDLPSLAAYQHAFGIWFADMNGRLTGLYRQLLQVRNALAQANGYTTYRAYADEQLYFRDVDTAVCAPLRAQVQTSFAPAVAQMYDLYYKGVQNPVSLEMKEGLQAVEHMIATTPQQLQDCYTYLKQHGSLLLCSLPNCSRTAYTFTFHQFNQPFVYVGWVPGSMGETAVLHELGHAFADFATDYAALEAYNSYEVMELQSMSLEYMSGFNSTALYGSYNQYAELWNSAQCVTNLAYMAAVGTFEDAVYQSPDMTDEEMLQLYVQIFEGYGLFGTQTNADNRMLWLENSIFVQSPFYADSYLLAGLGAAEMSLNYLDNPTQAMQHYMQLLHYQGDFTGALQQCGLSDIPESTYVEALYSRMQQKNLLSFQILESCVQNTLPPAA